MDRRRGHRRIIMLKTKLILLLTLILAASAIGQERFVKPVDKAKESKSFLDFRTKLMAAVERKDSKFIYSILDPHIELSFGGEHGVADFKKIWTPEKKDSAFWKEFLKVITHGGDFIGRSNNRLSSFAAPYLHTSWPDDIDPFENWVIFGNNVNLREKPSMDGNVIEQLSYNVVIVKDKVMKNEDEADWIKVETLGGKTGWIKAEYVRSAIDYRAGFEKKRGVWKMTFFIAGD